MLNGQWLNADDDYVQSLGTCTEIDEDAGMIEFRIEHVLGSGRLCYRVQLTHKARRQLLAILRKQK